MIFESIFSCAADCQMRLVHRQKGNDKRYTRYVSTVEKTIAFMNRVKGSPSLPAAIELNRVLPVAA
jgi:hypothetical protein